MDTTILNKGRDFSKKYQELLSGADLSGPFGVKDYEYNSWLQELKIEFALFTNGNNPLIERLDDISNLNHYYGVRLGGVSFIEPCAARHTAVMNFIAKNLGQGRGTLSQSLVENIQNDSKKTTTILNQHITVTEGGIVTTGDNNTINATITINKGNKEFLEKTLRNNKVPSEDINELIEVIDTEEPNPETLTFGKKVNTWISKMISKSLDGTWQIGLGTAAGVLAEIIQRYYGMK